MKHDLTTGTWQDDTGCPISIVLAATSDEQWRRSPVIVVVVSVDFAPLGVGGGDARAVNDATHPPPVVLAAPQ